MCIRDRSNSEQRLLDYKSIASKGETFRRIIEEKTAILDIGGGSIQISLFDKDTPVSYTHLDVYKRQVLGPWALIPWRFGIRWLAPDDFELWIRASCG